ncbi:hypothetical protein EHQ51_18035 [Pantoea ananatis]|nr:hypothetical protein EHQ51_18035 [Pantoea ananatis]
MGDIFGCGAMTITGLWLLYFYIEVVGLSPASSPEAYPWQENTHYWMVTSL